ncbi:MAG TPA: tail fiber protein [Flavipsychrobacter sp.]
MEGYIGEVRALPYNFEPEGWKLCAGQIEPIQQYTALFSVIGTLYGGNGSSTFALPNLLGRVPVSAGQRPGTIGVYNRGYRGGQSAVILDYENLPTHRHEVVGASVKGIIDKLVNTPVADTCYLSNAIDKTSAKLVYAYGNATNCTMSYDSISVEGKSEPHNNMMPYLAFAYYICWDGLYPRRSE